MTSSRKEIRSLRRQRSAVSCCCASLDDSINLSSACTATERLPLCDNTSQVRDKPTTQRTAVDVETCLGTGDSSQTCTHTLSATTAHLEGQLYGERNQSGCNVIFHRLVLAQASTHGHNRLDCCKSDRDQYTLL